MRDVVRRDDQATGADPSTPKETGETRGRRTGDSEGWVTIARSRLELLEGEILELRECLAKKDLELQEKDPGVPITS